MIFFEKIKPKPFKNNWCRYPNPKVQPSNQEKRNSENLYYVKNMHNTNYLNDI